MNHTDLNIKCAEAMGWTKQWTDTDPSFLRWKTPNWKGGEITYKELPFYTTSHDAAFTLVEKLRMGGWRVNIESCGTGWRVEFLNPNGSRRDAITHEATSPTLTLAICEAFVKTNGK